MSQTVPRLKPVSLDRSMTHVVGCHPGSKFACLVLREVPLVSDFDETVGPGTVTIRYEDVDGAPGGRALMEAYELDYVFVTNVNVVIASGAITTDVDTVGQLPPDACGLAAGTLTGNTLTWDGPITQLKSDGTVSCSGSALICDTAEDSFPPGGVIDTLGAQGVRPYTFNAQGDGFTTNTSIRLGANNNDCYLDESDEYACAAGPGGDLDPVQNADGSLDEESPKIWIRYEGAETSRTLDTSTPDCFCQ